MNKKILYQIRLDLNKEAADELINKKTLKDCENLLKLVKKESAELVCQYQAFKLFTEDCEKKNLTHMPLYKWTKDTISNDVKKKKYMKSFTIYVRSQQLYEKGIADRIEKKILSLKCECILKVNKYNSDPKNNPQPPKKYL